MRSLLCGAALLDLLLGAGLMARSSLAQGQPCHPRTPLAVIVLPAIPSGDVSQGDLDGEITLRFAVREDGSAEQMAAVAVNGHPQLMELARRTIARWRFAPVCVEERSATSDDHQLSLVFVDGQIRQGSLTWAGTASVVSTSSRRMPVEMRPIELPPPSNERAYWYDTNGYRIVVTAVALLDALRDATGRSLWLRSGIRDQQPLSTDTDLVSAFDIHFDPKSLEAMARVILGRLLLSSNASVDLRTGIEVTRLILVVSRDTECEAQWLHTPDGGRWYLAGGLCIEREAW